MLVVYWYIGGPGMPVLFVRRLGAKWLASLFVGLFVCRFAGPFQYEQFQVEGRYVQNDEGTILPVYRVAVAVPTNLSFSCLERRVVSAPNERGLNVRLYVAASTVIRSCFYAFVVYFCCLVLTADRGRHGVARAVRTLRHPLLCQVLVEGVAVVAHDVPSIETIRPNNVVKSRSVTVSTDYQIITRVNVHPRRVRRGRPSPSGRAKRNGNCRLPTPKEG